MCKIYLLLAALLTVINSFGCASLGGYHDTVRVTVADIQVEESTLFEQLYSVTLRIQNRTEHPISVLGGSMDLELNGKDFGSGVTAAELVIPAFGDAKIDVRMVGTLFGMLRVIRSFQRREGAPLDYRIAGRLAVEGVVGSLRFNESGELTLLSDAMAH